LDDADDKLECLMKIIAYQACKIETLEMRIKKIENALPNTGPLDEKKDDPDDPPQKKRKSDDMDSSEKN
jgi:hypothetical protein